MGRRPLTDTRPIVRWPSGSADDDVVVREEPLEIRVEGQSVAVTMRTPGHDLDLAAGFLFSEGVIDGPDDLVALAPVRDPGGGESNVVDAVLAGGVEAHREALERATRELYATSSCGICGKRSIDRVVIATQPYAAALELDPEWLVQLPGALLADQEAFRATGGLHAAGLFRIGGALDLLREDVGRHNAVDKVLGARLRDDRVPVDDCVLVVSSRAGFEIVQKAAVAGVPALAAVGAASTLAVDLAVRMRMRLVGFLRHDRYNVYA